MRCRFGTPLFKAHRKEISLKPLSMKDGAAILKILTVQNFVLINNNYRSEYVSMSSKTPPFILESFSFVKYNEEHLDLDPITDRQVSF